VGRDPRLRPDSRAAEIRDTWVGRPPYRWRALTTAFGSHHGFAKATGSPCRSISSADAHEERQEPPIRLQLVTTGSSPHVDM